MALSSGARFGPYEILGPLGAGGMGEVYRARDIRLDRLVAFKILPPDLAGHPGRRERFRREARAISSLNHSHICGLYDVGEEQGVAFLVMEYLEGETLAHRLVRGPLPLDQAVSFAVEIASALDHAHRQGIVHRDLKPSNVMLTGSGTKLLDFGLAKVQTSATAANLSTLSLSGAHETAEGTILGTFHYMAPEQLEGRDADARTDLFAFGALVYKMATGSKAFAGASQATVIAAILTSNPSPLSSLNPLAPAPLDRLIMRCLAKSPDDRWQTARDLLFELHAVAEGVTETVVTRAGEGANRVSPRTRSRLTAAAWNAAIAAAAAGLTLGGAYAWQRLADHPSLLPAERLQSEIPAPDNTNVGAIALSPDGRQLAFIGRNAGRSQLWLRALDATAARPLGGTDGADYPFWAPDSKSLGFFADGKLKRIDVAGGPSRTLADAQAPRGGTWSRNGVIVFAPNVSSLLRVSAEGGPSTPVTALDVSKGELSHRWPHFLPDGTHYLYLVQSSRPEDRAIFAGSIDGTVKKLLVHADVSAAYASPGYLLFLRDRMLMAQPFRATDLTLGGAPVAIAGPVAIDGLEHAHFEASQVGTLIYRRGGFLGTSEITQFGRDGRRIGTIGAPADYRGIRLSPDNRRLAVVTEDALAMTPDIWVQDVARNEATRFTFDLATDNDPVWSPDGERIAFRSTRSERFALFLRTVGGTSGETVILESNARSNAHIYDWSRDGRFALFSQVDPTGKSDRDVWVLPMQGESRPSPLEAAPYNQDYPRFSPNGKWVAYQTNEAGRYNIYVIPFPHSGGEWQVSTGGGIQPVWSADGRELYLSCP